MNKVSTTAIRLKEAMDVRHIRAIDLSQITGIGKSAISQYLSGKVNPKQDKVYALARALDVSESWLMGLDVEMEQGTANKTTEEALPSGAFAYDISKLHRIPVLGQIAAGLPLYAEENIEGYTYTDLNGGAEYFALRVKGDSMNALRINEGDIVIVRRQNDVENGEVAVVLVDGDSATLKRFYRTDSAITLMPQSTNAEHQPQVYDPAKTRIDVLGKVVKVEFML